MIVYFSCCCEIINKYLLVFEKMNTIVFKKISE